MLRGSSWSPTPSEGPHLETSADEEWSRRRIFDDASDREEVEQESIEMQREVGHGTGFSLEKSILVTQADWV